MRADRAALHQARSQGVLVISECVVTEVGPAVAKGRFVEFLQDRDIRFSPSTLASAVLAAQSFRHYLARGGRRGRIVPDFLIGAHAQLHADRLLARDRGFYRDYFTRVELWDPSRSKSRPRKSSLAPCQPPQIALARSPLIYEMASNHLSRNNGTTAGFLIPGICFFLAVLSLRWAKVLP
jgi:predicted nucleic acid-binding protein